jgi:hypothetical protein
MTRQKANLSAVLAPLAADARLGPSHLCLYLAILQCREKREVKGMFRIRKAEIMALAKIHGRTTYYRILNDLRTWGYIQYEPSFSKKGESLVALPAEVR